MRFRDRSEAGKQLAQKLSAYADDPNAIVLALPRGGVPVGYEVARFLRLPFDIFLVHKLGVPGQSELALGAIASGGVRILNEDVIDYLQLSQDAIEAVAQIEQRKLRRREQLYRGNRPLPHLNGKTVILVDDGLAAGATMRAAVSALRKSNPARVLVAAPVAASTTCEAFETLADDIVCICGRPFEPFYAVGLWYDDFSQTTDREVHELLARANQPAPVA
jgi:putative phosphoribosyl transferase